MAQMRVEMNVVMLLLQVQVRVEKAARPSPSYATFTG